MSRSCEELAVCRGLTPPCTYADGKTVACPRPASELRLAPGTVEGFKVGFLGTPAQRRELGRWVGRVAAWGAVLVVAGFAAGVMSGVLP